MKIKIIGLFTVLLISFSFNTRIAPKLGEQAPEIILLNNEGKEIKLSSLKGKMVLIDFWASWCGPCRQESPNVAEAYSKYKKKKFKQGKGFEVFSVSLDRNQDSWKKAIIDDKLVWSSHVLDKDGIASKKYEVYSIPSAFLINGKGKIVASGASLRGIGLHVEIEKELK